MFEIPSWSSFQNSPLFPVVATHQNRYTVPPRTLLYKKFDRIIITYLVVAAKMNLKLFISLSLLLPLQNVSCFSQSLPFVLSNGQLWKSGLQDDFSTGIPTNSQSALRTNRKSLFDVDNRHSTVSPIYASDTSFSFTDMLASGQGTWYQQLQRLRMTYPWLDTVCSQAVYWQIASKKLLLETWWLMPMLLILVPIYSAVVMGKCACMPDWWQVVRMDTIRQSKDAALIIGGFLVSNIAYFAAGGFLLARFPMRTVKKRNALVPLVKPTAFSMLGIWILLAGTVSTIFHSVQALGSHAISESLCYVDHAVAISAAFYFFKMCGFPSKRVWVLGIASLVTLVFCHPAYAMIHSLWHFLSAATATQWALVGYQRAQARESSSR